MRSLEEIKHILNQQKPFLAERYGVVEVGVFGSYARSEQGPESDVDILIDLEEPSRIDLLDLVSLEDHLRDVLDCDVDITLKSGLRKRIGRKILNEVVLL
jgi:uncharacterized protein